MTFYGLKPVFKTMSKYFTDIIEKEAVVISQYTPNQYGNPNSTVKPGGMYYSINEENASVTYHIPYIKTLVRGYSLTSVDTDVYPQSWILEASNDGENFTALHVANDPICEDNNIFITEYNKYYCTKSVTKKYTFSNDIYYSFYRIKMLGTNSGIDDTLKYYFLFSCIELYGYVQFPFKAVTCPTKVSSPKLLLLDMFFLSSP
jgi:hypothetical protein